MRTVIVGGGVIGLCCAYQLARRGVGVTVLDKGQPGQAASWGNAGWITPVFSPPLPAPGLVGTAIRWSLRGGPLSIQPWKDPSLIGWLWEFLGYCNAGCHQRGLEAVAGLNRDTMSLFDDLEADGVDCEMQRTGVLFLFSSERYLQHALADLRLMRSYGYETPSVISGRALRELEPAVSDGVIAGFVVPQERYVRPDKLIGGLVTRLMDLGADIRADVEVVGLRRGSSDAVSHLATSDGALVPADSFVISAGVWSASLGRLAGIRLPVQSGKGYSVTLREPTLRLRRPVYLSEARIACTPFVESLRLAGTMELSGPDPAVNRQRIQAMARGADAYLTDWSSAAEVEYWAGLRPLTPDGLPVVGLAPGFSNLYVATGHAMLGVTLGPVTGQAVADLICDGSSPIDLTPFDPARFCRGAVMNGRHGGRPLARSAG